MVGAGLPVGGREMKLPVPLATGALIFLCAVLGADLLYQLMALPPDIQAPHVALRPQVAGQAAAHPFNPPSLSQFSAIDERSVFDPMRGPVFSPATQDSSEAGTPSDFTLVGIIMGPERRIAVVKTPGAASAQNISVGDTINTWRVTRIEPDFIVVQGGGADHDVKVPLHPSAHTVTPAGPPEQDEQQ